MKTPPMILETQINQSSNDKEPKWTHSVSHLKWTDPWAVRESKIAQFIKKKPMILEKSQIDRSLSGKGPKWTHSVSHLKWTDSWVVKESK